MRVLLWLAAWACPLALSAQEAALEAAAASPVAASAPQTEVPPASSEETLVRRPRLKFRDGPACMCAPGLSEKEIAAGRIDQVPASADDRAP